MIGPYFDPLGETEPHTTEYILTVFCPPCPSPRWLPDIFTRPGPSQNPNVGSKYTIRPSDYNPARPNYDNFELRHLADMKKKTVKITSAYFPAHMRCKHVMNNEHVENDEHAENDDHVEDKHSCDKGCYVLEMGGDVSRWTCEDEECEGHVYCGSVMKDPKGRACFGTKGTFRKKSARMVCIER